MTTTSERLAAVRQRLTATLARLQAPVAGFCEFAHLEAPRSVALTVICDDGACADLDVVDVCSHKPACVPCSVAPEWVGHSGFLGFAQLAQLRDAPCRRGRAHDTMLARLFAHARAVGMPVRPARQHLAEAAVHAGASVAPAAVGAPIKRGSVACPHTMCLPT